MEIDNLSNIFEIGEIIMIKNCLYAAEISKTLKGLSPAWGQSDDRLTTRYSENSIDLNGLRLTVIDLVIVRKLLHNLYADLYEKIFKK